MREWCSWYAFNKMDDGTYQAELDEAWCWGGSHNDGGTIRREIPEEWLDLPYDDFLKEVVRIASAAHYGFTPELLKERAGLKEFSDMKNKRLTFESPAEMSGILFYVSFALVAAARAAINCSGVGVLPPNCDQNITASGSVDDIPTLIISSKSLRTSLTGTPCCFATFLIVFIMIYFLSP